MNSFINLLFYLPIINSTILVIRSEGLGSFICRAVRNIIIKPMQKKLKYMIFSFVQPLLKTEKSIKKKHAYKDII